MAEQAMNHNCMNCGAPVDPGKRCEYCGTLKIEKSADKVILEGEKIGMLPSREELILYAEDRIVERILL